MESVDFLGYLGALFVGIVLGLIGGGGSILTVPVLVYLFGLNPILSTAYSLFVVGVTSLIGAFQNLRNKLVDVKTALIFALPSFIAVYATRRWLVPAMPEELFSIGTLTVTKNIFIMVFFAIIMLLAALSMIMSKSKPTDNINTEIQYNYPLIAIEGIIVGALTGIVGAGGGFLIIPALVLFAKLPMKKAVGTSLFIISAKSLIGFLGDVQTLDINWKFLMIFTSISILGILLGVYLSRFISGQKLKKGFGWFTLFMALYILSKELSA